MTNQTPASSDRRLKLALVALLVAAWAGALGAIPWAPAQVPTHWGLDGNSDGYMARVPGLLLFPALTTAVVVLFRVLPRIDPLRANYRSFQGTYRFIQLLLAFFLTAMQYLVIANILGWNVNMPTVITILVGLLLIGLGDVMGKLRPNWFAGIRTPWTLSSPDVWTGTHRVSGRLMVLLGIVTVLAGIFVPPPAQMAILLGGVLLLAVVSFAYSYWLWHKLTHGQLEPGLDNDSEPTYLDNVRFHVGPPF